jgi:hypothetical protein
MSLWDALTDIQKKVTEGVEQFQEVFDPNAVASPPSRARPVPSAAFSVDNDDTATKKPGEDVPARRPDASQFASVVPKPQTNSGGPSRTLASASRDELVALVQRQAAKIQQLQARSDESHQENQVLRQERDSLKNMLRASDAELTEAKKARAAAQVVIPSSQSVLEDASLVESLRSQIVNLQFLLSEKNASKIVDEGFVSSVAAKENTSAVQRHSAEDDCSKLQQQLESLLQQNQNLEQLHASALHAAHQQISLLQSENGQAAASNSYASAQAEAVSNELKDELAKSQAHAASLCDVVSELRAKVCALEASFAIQVSSTNLRVSSDSVSVQTSDIISSPSESFSLTEMHSQKNVSSSRESPSHTEHLSACAPVQLSQEESLKVSALAESSASDAITYRSQLLVAESRISELIARVDELQSSAVKQEQQVTSIHSAQLGNLQTEYVSTNVEEISAIRSEMDDLITAMDHLSAAVASVNFPNQPALPSHSLPCHLSKVAFTSFKQLADAVDAVVSQLVRYPPLFFAFTEFNSSRF